MGRFFLVFGIAVLLTGCGSGGGAGLGVSSQLNSVGENYKYHAYLGEGVISFSQPSGLHIQDNEIYVADLGNNLIRKFSSQEGLHLGNFHTSTPNAVTTDVTGRIITTDPNNHCVWVLDSLGNPQFSFGSEGNGEGQFQTPYAVVTDVDGNIYVSDYDNHNIQKFSSDGSFLQSWGQDGERNGIIRNPIGMVFNQSGELLVADTENNQIITYSINGDILAIQQCPYPPYTIAKDNSDNLYVLYARQCLAIKYSPDGSEVCRFGTRGNSPGEFISPWGLAVTPDGSGVYVSDQTKNNVQIFVWTN